jgi:hypothetical protein
MIRRNENYVKQYQLRQRNLLDEIRAVKDVRDLNSLYRAYDDTVNALVLLLGAEAPVAEVDVGLSKYYADWYQSEYGQQPDNAKLSYASVAFTMEGVGSGERDKDLEAQGECVVDDKSYWQDSHCSV